MNQIVGKKADGTPFLLLALEPGNIHRLQKHEPIALRIEDLFPDGIPKRLQLEIFYSETPIADARDVAKHAEVTLDERTPVSEKKRPHCPECRSTIEQLGVWQGDVSPLALVFCAVCGCVFGSEQRIGMAAKGS